MNQSADDGDQRWLFRHSRVRDPGQKVRCDLLNPSLVARTFFWYWTSTIFLIIWEFLQVFSVWLNSLQFGRYSGVCILLLWGCGRQKQAPFVWFSPNGEGKMGGDLTAPDSERELPVSGKKNSLFCKNEGLGRQKISIFNILQTKLSAKRAR